MLRESPSQQSRRTGNRAYLLVVGGLHGASTLQTRQRREDSGKKKLTTYLARLRVIHDIGFPVVELGVGSGDVGAWFIMIPKITQRLQSGETDQR